MLNMLILNMWVTCIIHGDDNLMITCVKSYRAWNLHGLCIVHVDFKLKKDNFFFFHQFFFFFIFKKGMRFFK